MTVLPRAERDRQDAVEACGDAVAVAVCVRCRRRPRSGSRSGPGSARSPSVGASRYSAARSPWRARQLGQRPAPLQLVAGPAQDRRRARVRRHARRERVLVADALGDHHPAARTVLVGQPAHRGAVVGTQKRQAVEARPARRPLGQARGDRATADRPARRPRTAPAQRGHDPARAQREAPDQRQPDAAGQARPAARRFRGT